MIKSIKVTARILYGIILRSKLVVKNCASKSTYEKVSLKSYNADKCLKSGFVVFFENIIHIIKYGEINGFYFLYSQDVKGGGIRQDLMPYRQFMKFRNTFNQTRPYSYVCILRDKNLFSIVADGMGYPSAKNIGILNCGLIKMLNKTTTTIEDLLKTHNSLFFKPLNAECGEGIFSAGLSGGSYHLDGKVVDLVELQKKIERVTTDYLVQDMVVQHKEMSRLYPNAINTLRIVTVRNIKTGKVDVLHSLLRIGAHGNIVDNWAKGGIAIGIKPDGFLCDSGFFKPSYGKQVGVHPDTGVTFSSFKIPYYEQAILMCRSFHADLEHIGSIGWDVAITENGPLFIEGNDNWEISLHQSYGGLKSRFEQLQK